VKPSEEMADGSSETNELEVLAVMRTRQGRMSKCYIATILLSSLGTTHQRMMHAA